MMEQFGVFQLAHDWRAPRINAYSDALHFLKDNTYPVFCAACEAPARGAKDDYLCSSCRES